MNNLFVALSRAAIAVAFAGAALAPALAAGPLKVEKSVDVAADAGKTWDAVKQFGGLHTWHPAVEKTDMKKGGDNKTGSVRVLHLKGGGTITETLTQHSDQARSLSYRIDESPLPVDAYDSTLVVKPGKSGATVTWTSSFKAKAGTPDAEAKKVIEGIYDAGLGNLKKQLGG